MTADTLAVGTEVSVICHSYRVGNVSLLVAAGHSQDPGTLPLAAVLFPGIYLDENCSKILHGLSLAMALKEPSRKTENTGWSRTGRNCQKNISTGKRKEKSCTQSEFTCRSQKPLSHLGLRWNCDGVMATSGSVSHSQGVWRMCHCFSNFSKTSVPDGAGKIFYRHTISNFEIQCKVMILELGIEVTGRLRHNHL
jgi:hypothetical protein